MIHSVGPEKWARFLLMQSRSDGCDDQFNKTIMVGRRGLPVMDRNSKTTSRMYELLSSMAWND